MSAALKEWLGLLRSLVVYWRPGRQGGLRRLYRPWVGPGDLVFDLGAHLGDRSAAFAALGARVVALEPQPLIARWLARIVGGNDRITVRTEAVGRSPGTGELAVSRRTPTVSTLADDWRQRLPRDNPGFRDVRWDDRVTVPVTTLDELIDRYGVPAFCKIDVEGHEAEALAGLSRPLSALSFEFVSGGLDVAVDCVRRLERLGAYEFNAVAGERRSFLFDRWMDAGATVEWLAAGAGELSSGDLYARRLGGDQTRPAEGSPSPEGSASHEGSSPPEGCTPPRGPSPRDPTGNSP